MKRMSLIAVALAGAGALLGACRGQPSEQQPVHLLNDMDWQAKYQPGERNPFFADGRAMRPLVSGVVAQGTLHEDEALHKGMVGDAYVAKVPMAVDEKVVKRGRERYNIYCAPCHDQAGAGKGMVVQRGYPPPVDLASDHVRGMPDGQIFATVTNGVRNMPSYRKQIPVEDRWAIVAWVRVLQRSQHAAPSDVPPDLVDKLESAPGGTR